MDGESYCSKGRGKIRHAPPAPHLGVAGEGCDAARVPDHGQDGLEEGAQPAVLAPFRRFKFNQEGAKEITAATANLITMRHHATRHIDTDRWAQRRGREGAIGGVAREGAPVRPLGRDDKHRRVHVHDGALPRRV